mgnify:CR=1 FL=1
MLDGFKLYISPCWFLKAEMRHQKRLQAEYPAWGKINEGEILERVTKKRNGVYLSFLLVLSCLILGVFTAYFINCYVHVSSLAIRCLQLTSVGIIAWAVLSRLGYESETMKGLTLLEISSLNSFKVLYLFAIYLAAICLFLVPTST